MDGVENGVQSVANGGFTEADSQVMEDIGNDFNQFF